jgi:hypothetical protein
LEPNRVHGEVEFVEKALLLHFASVIFSYSSTVIGNGWTFHLLVCYCLTSTVINVKEIFCAVRNYHTVEIFECLCKKLAQLNTGTEKIWNRAEFIS